MKETDKERSGRIINQLKLKYPGKNCFDMYGDGMHVVCELEPTNLHPEYDKAVEVIISSKPHRHLKTTQYYKILKGALELHDDDRVVTLQEGDEYKVASNHIHWAISNNEAWVEITSKPGWTKEDHIKVNL